MTPVENAAAVVAAPGTTAPPMPRRADFADWLSPMLVKELRQGVRTRVFVLLFILLQVFMLLDLVLSLLVAASGVSASEGTFFFWLMVAVPTLLIIPLSGLNAIGGEIKGNTLELIFLTRLTAFRIVVGKWLALFGQVLLLVCAALPYLVLRYFMGGVNLANELFLLGMMLVGSALLIAIATGVSAFPTRLVRPLSVLLGLIAFYWGAIFFVEVFMRGRMTSSLPDLTTILTVLVSGAILILLALDMGAARIAPPAENHSATMRLLTLAGLGLAAVTSIFSRRFTGISFGAFVVAAIVCAVAVCEEPRAIPSLYRPFARRGWPGRMVGRFFYPGWHTGTLFLLGMFVAFAALFARERMFFNDETVARFVALVGTLLLPVALVRTVFRRANRPAAIFFILQGVSGIVFVFCVVCDNALDTGLKHILPFLPLCALISPWSDSSWRNVEWTLPVFAVTTLSVLAVVIASFPAFRQTRALERASLALPAPPSGRPSKLTPPAAPDAPLA